MMNGRFISYLFVVILVVSIFPINSKGKERTSSDKDFIELLEMQLADIKQENKRLTSELEKAGKESQSKSGYKKDIENLKKENSTYKKDAEGLKKENSLLKAEIIKLDKNVETVTKNKAELLVKLEKLRKDKAKNAKKSGDNGKNEELKARCTNLEDENAILKKEVDKQTQLAKKSNAEFERVKGDLDQLSESSSKDKDKGTKQAEELKSVKKALAEAEAKLAEVKSSSAVDKGASDLKSKIKDLKAVEVQRKEALDDLFKQLANVKYELKVKETEISALEAKAKDNNGVIKSKDAEIDAKLKQIKKMQAVIDSHSESQSKLQKELKEAKALVESKVKDLNSAVAKRQSQEEELQRIKMTDVERKKTMDDVLAKLATAESLNSESSAKIKKLEGKLSTLTSQSESEIKSLKDRNKILDNEIARMDQEAKDTVAAKKTLQSKVTEGSVIAKRDAARIVELEADQARMKATDTQRKKNMDKILLQISELEDSVSSKSKEVESARKEVEKSRADVAAMRKGLTDARNSLAKSLAEIKELKARKPKVSKGDSKDMTAKVAALQQEKEQLMQKIKSLEGSLSEAKSATSKQVGNDDELSKRMEQDKAQWMKSKADLESEISHLQKSNKDQQESYNSIKADLAEAEQAKEQLSQEVSKLQNRKIDVRKSDLFLEMEAANVKLREKIVQIESEREKLAKSNKKFLKRDEHFDDEISHEENLRHKAEDELSDARSREAEHKELIERLMAQVPQLEAQISDMTAKEKETSNKLTDREEDLVALKAELEKRDHRLIKAEKVAEVLENARENVLHASDKEKLNMYYNMAAVYAKEGKYEDAEQEYLHALSINPTDADVHYNLGILYDDELNEPEKAIAHYRRYLKLNPHSPDADQVRNWLMKLEMKDKR